MRALPGNAQTRRLSLPSLEPQGRALGAGRSQAEPGNLVTNWYCNQLTQSVEDRPFPLSDVLGGVACGVHALRGQTV